MRRILICLCLVLATSGTAQAVKVTPFIDIPTYVKRAKEIVIARAIKPADVAKRPLEDGLDVWEVDVLQVLKGSVAKGPLRVVNRGPLERSKIYLLYSLGGSTYRSEFLAISELSVVEVPQRFKLNQLGGKTLTAQVEAIFRARQQQLELDLKRLQEEKALLDKAVAPLSP